MLDLGTAANGASTAMRCRAANIVERLDRTQGHLVLRWNAWRAPAALQRIGLPTLYSLVALIFLLGFARESYVHGRTAHGHVLVGFAALTVVAYVFLIRFGHRQAVNTFLVCLLGALCLFLLYTGGVERTGPLWYYVFPLFALFVQRLWAGVLSVLLLLAATVIVFAGAVPGFNPDMYAPAFRERFLAVYVAVSLMAFFYALLRVSAEMELRDLTAELTRAANTDRLTRLPNRRAIEDLLYQEISRVRRHGGTFSVVLMDLDHFKQINDRYGHECGDEVLRSVPALARQALRAQDVCGRWGGEEFLIVLPATGAEGARQVAERLRAVIEAHTFAYAGARLRVTASFGVSEFSRLDTLHECVRRADAALYEAKAAGRNRVV